MGGKFVAVLVAVALACGSAGIADAGPTGGALPPALVQVLQVAGEHGVPHDAEMVAVNITAVTPAGPGHVRAYACDQEPPDTSNLNYLDDDIVPNLALVRIADDGSICLDTHEVTDLVVDVVGYVPAGSAITPLETPDRATDTRRTERLEAGRRMELSLGRFVPDEAELVMFNLTAAVADAPGHATVFPCTASVPSTSTINYVPGRTVANFVIARLSDDGRVCLSTHSTSHFIVDVVAYATGGITTLDRPIRIRDTRRTGEGPVGGGSTLRLDIANVDGVPTDVTSAVYNLTAPAAQAVGHATSYPCDRTRPTASNLNYRPDLTAANGTITKLSPTGELCIFTHATTHLVVDLIGYTTDTTSFVPLSPTRILDTRRGWRAECSWVAVGEWETLEQGHLLDVHPLDGSPPVRNSGFFDYSSNLRPGSSLDCAQVLSFGSGDSDFESRLVGLSTTTSNAPRVQLGNSIAQRSYRAVQQQYDGSYLAVDREGVVIDAQTGGVLWEHPDIHYAAFRAAISRNGLVALRTGSHFETTIRDGSGRIEVWDIATGEAVSLIDVPDRNIEFDLSPDGTYLAIDLSDSLDASPVTFITTILGDVVEVRPTASRAITRFLGPGVVTQCVDGEGLTKHDLFGPWVSGFLPRIAPEAATYGVPPCRAIWP